MQGSGFRILGIQGYNPDNGESHGKEGEQMKWNPG